MKRIVIFDLDETVVDSKHRTPNNPDGTLNLEKYFESKTRENTLRDTLLPLAGFWRSLCRQTNYIAVCTARNWESFDQEFLDIHGLCYDTLMTRPWGNLQKDADLKHRWITRLRNLRQFRNLPVYMFEDATPVISRMRQNGVVCMNAHKINSKLS